MSKFHNVPGCGPTVGEIMGTAPEIKTEGERCSYCERGWGKGFTACPECGLRNPWVCHQPGCRGYLDENEDGGNTCEDCGHKS